MTKEELGGIAIALSAAEFVTSIISLIIGSMAEHNELLKISPDLAKSALFCFIIGLVLLLSPTNDNPSM